MLQTYMKQNFLESESENSSKDHENEYPGVNPWQQISLIFQNCANFCIIVKEPTQKSC